MLETAIKQVETIEVEATLAEAAQMMADHNVGALIVTDGRDIAGIVTDRDLVVRGLAHKLPAESRIDAVMTLDPVLVDVDCSLEDVVEVFRTHAVRRLPVIRGGELAGMITCDDLFVALSGELAAVARPIVGETVFPTREPDVPAVR
jgi:CBS domain-containing protein